MKKLQYNTRMANCEEKLIIKGGRALCGEVKISGAKNAVLKHIAAAILASDVTTIYNVPELTDVAIMLEVIGQLGAKTSYNKEEKYVTIDASTITNTVADKTYVSKMRASFNVLGALVGRMGEAKVALPGGCAIGERRVNFHIKGIEALGAKCEIKDGYVIAKAKKLTGADICFDIPSVGATENVMFASIFAEGTTRIQNAAQEPEIVDLANFLKSMGAKITGEGTSEIVIQGIQKHELHGTCYTTIPDRIEAGTYISAIIATRGNGIIRNIFPSHLTIYTGKLLEMGAKIKLIDPNTLQVSASRRLDAQNFITQPYPGFPTDLQACAMMLLAISNGVSVMTESLYENRFMHVEELWKMGANIRISKNHAIIKGVEKYTGAEVRATDLRAGGALVAAGLAAEGETVVTNLHHIDRGYEKFVEKLQILGADIIRTAVAEGNSNECEGEHVGKL